MSKALVFHCPMIVWNETSERIVNMTSIIIFGCIMIEIPKLWYQHTFKFKFKLFWLRYRAWYSSWTSSSILKSIDFDIDLKASYFTELRYRSFSTSIPWLVSKHFDIQPVPKAYRKWWAKFRSTPSVRTGLPAVINHSLSKHLKGLESKTWNDLTSANLFLLERRMRSAAKQLEQSLGYEYLSKMEWFSLRPQRV